MIVQREKELGRTWEQVWREEPTASMLSSLLFHSSSQAKVCVGRRWVLSDGSNSSCVPPQSQATGSQTHSSKLTTRTAAHHVRLVFHIWIRSGRNYIWVPFPFTQLRECVCGLMLSAGVYGRMPRKTRGWKKIRNKSPASQRTFIQTNSLEARQTEPKNKRRFKKSVFELNLRNPHFS